MHLYAQRGQAVGQRPTKLTVTARLYQRSGDGLPLPTPWNRLEIEPDRRGRDIFANQ